MISKIDNWTFFFYLLNSVWCWLYSLSQASVDATYFLWVSFWTYNIIFIREHTVTLVICVSFLLCCIYPTIQIIFGTFPVDYLLYTIAVLIYMFIFVYILHYAYFWISILYIFQFLLYNINVRNGYTLNDNKLIFSIFLGSVNIF